MDHADSELLAYIVEHQGVSQECLADRLKVSSRTVRTRIARINDEIVPYAEIILERGFGYRVTIANRQKLDEISRVSRDRSLGAGDQGARVAAMAREIICSQDEWTTLDVLAERFYVSRSTASRDLQLATRALARFDVRLENRPYRGIRAVGSEGNKRSALVSLVPGAWDVPEDVASSVFEIVRGRHIELSRDAFQSLRQHIGVSIARIRAGRFISMSPEQLMDIRSEREFVAAREIADLLEESTGLGFSDDEAGGMAILLLGKQTLALDAYPGIDMIPDEIWDVVTRILDEVWRAFGFDFRSDLELRMNLARHIVPLSVRLKHRLEQDNDLTDHIRNRYPLAFSMALCSSTVLRTAYGHSVSDGETAYLALAFALALDRQKSDVIRKNILVVCSTGQGSARLLEYRCRQEFGPYINEVTACDVAHIKDVDFSTIDYVFTTVPLECEVPVPIRMVSLFLDSSDVEGIRHLFQMSSDASGILQFFSSRLFFPHLDAQTKWDAIHELACALVSSDEAFADLEMRVIERERAFPTSFGDDLAVPHAPVATGPVVRIAVGLLDHPVVWDEDGHMVSVVLLVSYSVDGKASMPDIFTAIAGGLFRPGALKALLTERSFGTLAKLLDPDS